MRKILILLFAFWLIPNYAQNISVSSFKSLDTDLTANTAGSMEIDQNGETAALIKVVTTQTGFTFDGGALGIVKTKQTPGEIWVYIPRGSKKISIKHPQLGVLRDYFFPVPIEAARTYEMVLVAGEVQTIVKKARTSQYVVFEVTPPDAVVELEGELLKTEGGIASKMVKFGTYNYRVQAPDYYLEAGSVTVNDPENKKVVKISLKPNFAQVTISVDNDAEIWINGEKKGHSSWTGNLGAGIYELEAKKAGHRSTLLTKDIVVTQEPQIIKLQTPAPVYGEADFNSLPGKADIYIDGNKVGQTPQLVSKLLIGDHQVRICKEGYEDFISSIIVSEVEAISLNAELKKIEVSISYSNKNSVDYLFGFVDTSDIFQSMPEYNKARSEIDALQAQYEADMKYRKDELQKKVEAFDKEQASLPDDIKQRRQQELQDMYNKLQQGYQDTHQALQKAAEEKLQVITNKVLKVIEAIGKDYGVLNIYELHQNAGIVVNPNICNDFTQLVKYNLGNGGKKKINLVNKDSYKVGYVSFSDLSTMMGITEQTPSEKKEQTINKIKEAILKVANTNDMAFILNIDLDGGVPFINKALLNDVTSHVKNALGFMAGESCEISKIIKNCPFGHLKTQEIIPVMHEYKMAKTEVDALQAQYEADLKSMQDELQKRGETFDKEQASLPDNIKQRRQQELQDMYTKIQQRYKDNEQALQKASQERMDLIISKLLKVINEVGVAGKYAVIHDTVPLFINSDISVDVTKAVRTKLGL